MIKASDVVGRSVTIREGGQEAGKVRDLVVDGTGKQVVGFIISEGLLKGTKVAPWSALQAVGPDSIVLGSRSSIVKLEAALEIKEALEQDTNIRGLRLQTTEGKELGKVEDFYFNEVSGAVEGYELSGGLMADAFSGKSFLPTPDSIELGKDIAFVGPEAEGTIKQESGGFRRHGFKKDGQN